uniref:F-box domain-containing protein n=1 Tax=Steinernema glaseri TaxID=37863 RepID=A0A1I8AH09_9BILA
MNSVPYLFTRAVVSLLHGSTCYKTEDLAELASSPWADEAERHVRDVWQYSIDVAPPRSHHFYPWAHERGYQVLLSRRRSTGDDDPVVEYITIDDFDTFDVAKDAVWVWVTLKNHIRFSREHISRTPSLESLTKCLRRILGGRDCVDFFCDLELPYYNLLEAFPRTFRSLTFTYLNREVEEFVMDTMKLQRVSELDLKGTDVSKEFEDFLHKVMVNAEMHYIRIKTTGLKVFGFSVFKRILQRWMKSPESFYGRDTLFLYLPVGFSSEKIE